MDCYVGLDVHNKASVFMIQDGCGQVITQGEVPTTPEGFRRKVARIRELAETAAEAERLRAAIAARYRLAPHDAADHPLFLVGTGGGAARAARGARRPSRPGPRGVPVRDGGTTEVLARVGAEVLSGLR
jgi:hypothetical protein